MNVATEMPKYRSHKIVHALQIKEVIGAELFFVEDGYASVVCDPKMFSRYTPQPFDYYVVYDDGYKSFSPRMAFETGYTRIE